MHGLFSIVNLLEVGRKKTFKPSSMQNEVKYFIINVKTKFSYKDYTETHERLKSKEKIQLKFAI